MRGVLLALISLLAVSSAGCADGDPDIQEIHHYYEPAPRQRDPVMQPDGIIEWHVDGGEWGTDRKIETTSEHDHADGPLSVPAIDERKFEVRYTGNTTNLTMQWSTPAGRSIGPSASFDWNGPGARFISVWAQRTDGAQFYLDSVWLWEHTFVLRGTLPADSATDAPRHEFYVPTGNTFVEIESRATDDGSSLGRAATLAASWDPYSSTCRTGATGLGRDDTDHYLEGSTWGSRVLISYGLPPEECGGRSFPNLEPIEYEITVRARADEYFGFWH